MNLTLLKLGIQVKKAAVVEVDYLELCTQSIRVVEDFANRGNLLNQRQCQDLSSKLLLHFMPNIRKLVSHGGSSSDTFRHALERLYRHVEKAKALVSNCGDKDWLTAVVFQNQNENAFRQILLDIGLCYNVIYEQARNSSGGSNDFPEDLRLSSLFLPATESDVHDDEQDLKKRLEDVAIEPSSSAIPTLKQCLASYLLLKWKHAFEQSVASALFTGSAIFWAKEREPRGTWGMRSQFLGAGSGGSGVCKTKWMGIRCAKKEFVAIEDEAIFRKEADILAHLNHPCIVKFFCCGNEKRGKRFIAMELMEKSLLKLIEEQKGEPFPILTAVDLMVQMARGVCYLHGQGIAHRDLKPLNVVVNTLSNPHVGDHFCVKLVDFGMSKTKVEASKANTMSGYIIGTRGYIAPEVYGKAHLSGDGKRTWVKADVFSFAMTCAHVLSLKTPFGSVRPSALYHELVKGTRPELPANCPKELVGLLQACWDIELTSRPSFIEICTRLEILQDRLLRGISSPHQGSQELDSDEPGFHFIKEMVKEQYAIRKVLGDSNSDEVDEIELTTVDEVENELVEVGAIETRNVVSVISCPCGESLEFLPQAPYGNGVVVCDICCIQIDVEVYHCANCQFDAHKDCAEISDEVKVFFHADPLHLLVEYYHDNSPHITCGFCEEVLQGSKWVYNCKECNFNVHALCTKHAQKVILDDHVHPLTLVQSPTRKLASCDSCDGDFKGYRYTCTRKGCPFDLHPSCITLPRNPLCIFDSSHRLEMKQDFRKRFHCGKCGGLGFSWCYTCSNCSVDIHVNCVYNMEVEEAYDWNEAYEQLMLEYRNKGDHAEMASIIVELLDMLLTNTGLKTSSSLASRLQPVLIRVQPLVSSAVLKKAHSWDAFDDVDLQRKIVVEREERKAKRMVVTVARVKARAELVSEHGGKLENLKRLLQEHMKILELDTRVFLEAQEKLRKLEDFVYGVLNSKVGQVPRIVLRASGYRLLSPWDHRYLLNYMMLLCEEPSHEHIVIVHSGYRSFPHSILVVCDKQDLEKIEPFLITGLHVVRKALYKSANITNIESLDKVTGIVNSYQLPILGEKLWDLRAINVEKSDVQTNMAQEDEEEDADFDVELQAGTEAIATQWLRNYFEDESMSIFKESGLLRVRYTTTEQGDYPRYEHGSFAWLCDKHQNEGVEAGVLEPCPLRTYHNLKYDMEHGFPN